MGQHFFACQFRNQLIRFGKTINGHVFIQLNCRPTGILYHTNHHMNQKNKNQANVTHDQRSCKETKTGMSFIKFSKFYIQKSEPTNILKIFLLITAKAI